MNSSETSKKTLSQEKRLKGYQILTVCYQILGIQMKANGHDCHDLHLASFTSDLHQTRFPEKSQKDIVQPERRHQSVGVLCKHTSTKTSAGHRGLRSQHLLPGLCHEASCSALPDSGWPSL